MRKTELFLGVVVALALPATLCGQVGLSNPGQVLDSNYQIGSGGLNRVVGGVGRVNSQLYITGQVTGLGQFHGDVGYFAPNQLNLDLPSAGLSTFRQQSVGVLQAVRSETFHTYAYYDTSRTVLSVRDTAAGLAVPGSNVPRISAVPPSMVRRLYTDALADYRPIITRKPGQALSAGPNVPGAPVVGAVPTGAAATAPRITRPGATALFGVLRAEDREELARQLSATLIRDGRIDTVVDTWRDTRVQRPGETTETQAPETPAEDPSGLRLPKPDQDVFLDVLLQLRDRRREEKDTDARPPDPRVGEPGQSPTGKFPAPRQGRLVGTGQDGIVLHSLAGQSHDTFNVYMQRAEEKLKSGKFYEAAGQYEMAMIVDPRNPLARMGKGLALLGAGESRTAGANLRRALDMFAPLMEMRVSIESLMGKDIVTSRLGWLDRRLQKPSGDQQLIVFLMTFAQQNAGNVQAARKYAEMLKDKAKKDKVLEVYAEYILTGKTPAEQDQPLP